MKLITLWIYSLLGTATCLAQETILRNYTTETGLPSNMIYDIYRDSQGYLWFGTDNGIARYNGIYFETFSAADGLPDKEIFFFKEDYQGRIWMSTFNGELCYYQDNKFHTSANTPFLRLPFARSDTKFITVHPDSSISMYFMNGKDYFINIKGDKLRTINIRKLNLQGTDLQCIMKPTPGIYEVLAGNHKTRIDEQGNILHIEPTTYNKQYSLSYTQDSVFLFDDEGIYNLRQQILHRFDKKKTKKIIRVYFNKNRLLFGSGNGLLLDDRELLADNRVSSITQDIHGNIWAGTLGNGVFKMKRNYELYGVQSAVYEGEVTCSYQHSDEILFATSVSKLYCLHKKATQIRPIADLSLPKESVQYIDSNFFYASNGSHMCRIATSGKNCIPSCHDLNFGSPKTLIAHDSIAYYHYQNNILAEQLRTGHFTSITQNAQARIFWMTEDSQKRVWFATGQVYKIEENKAIQQRQFGNLSFKWFRFFDDLFIGVTQSGALIVSKTVNKIKLNYHTVQEPCAWENVYRVDDKHFLFATDGYYRLMTIHSTATDTLRFSIRIIENEFIPRRAEHITADETSVYFFAERSVYTLPIRELLNRPARPVITAVQFSAGKKEYNTRQHIRLPHTAASNILLRIRSLSFDSRDLRYVYSISDNEQDHWNTTTLAQMNLVVPGYGQYLVKIKAMTISGVESKPYVIQLTVLRPFYLQWWFLAVAGMLLCALMLLAVRIRIHYLLNKREKEYRLKMKILKSEYKALNALMNPHFIFNSLNSIQGFINKGNKEAANRYLHLFSHLMRQNMHNISKELVSLAEETELVRNYLLLEKMRYDERFEYAVDIENDIDEEDLFIPPLLIQPLAENAIKHGLLLRQSPGQLWIRIRMQLQRLIIEVEDNGVGFTPHNRGSGHQSFALGNIQSRIAQLNELHHNAIEFHIDSTSEGTKVTVCLDTIHLAQEAKDRF